jgi:hypothetical protein
MSDWKLFSKLLIYQLYFAGFALIYTDVSFPIPVEE